MNDKVIVFNQEFDLKLIERENKTFTVTDEFGINQSFDCFEEADRYFENVLDMFKSQYR